MLNDFNSGVRILRGGSTMYRGTREPARRPVVHCYRVFQLSTPGHIYIRIVGYREARANRNDQCARDPPAAVARAGPAEVTSG